MPAKPASPETPTRSVEQLGAAVARFRKLHDQSQAEVARSAGMRQATLSRVESGKADPSLKTVYALCAALGLELVVRPR